MFFFFHLMTGIILGYILSDILKDWRWFIPCILGAVLPDIIDKTLGYVLLPSSIGNGRIYTHTLLIIAILFILGALFWKQYKDPGILGLGTGILSHQVLDLMWQNPAAWYYPLAGPIRGYLHDDGFVLRLLLTELKNPFEILLVLLLGALFVTLLARNRISARLRKHREVVHVAAMAGAILLCIISGLAVGLGFARQTLKNIGWTKPEEMVIGGIVIALSAYLVWRWQKMMCDPV